MRPAEDRVQKGDTDYPLAGLRGQEKSAFARGECRPEAEP